MFQAVEIEGEAYWDGGFSANPPIAPLLGGVGRAEILLVLVNALERAPPRSRDAIMSRMSDITANASLLRDLEGVKRLQTIALVDPPEAASAKLNNDPGVVAGLQQRGRAAAAAWLAGQGGDPERPGWWRGIAGTLGPETAAQWLEQFKARLARLR